MTQPSASSSRPNEEVLHPSLGQSGYLVSYLPLPLFHTVSNQGPSTYSTRDPTVNVIVPPASIPTIFAHRQWRAGMLLSDLIYTDIVQVKGKKVFELGAGTGLPGIQSALKQREQGGFTVITDYDEPSLVKVLKENVSRNLGDEEEVRRRLKSNGPGGVRVTGHIWNKSIDDLLDYLPSSRSLDLPSSEDLQLFDLILLADCLWDPLSHSDLLKSITSTLSKSSSSTIAVVAGLHTGRENLVSFMRRAHRVGLKLKPLSEGLKDRFQLLEEGDKDLELRVKESRKDELDENDPLYKAEETVLEVELSGKDELVKGEDGDGRKQNSNSSLPEPETPTQLSKEEVSLSPGVEPAQSFTEIKTVNEDRSRGERSIVNSKHLYIEAHHHRLTGKRREFVVEERKEERKEIGGVKQRNRWITIWALGWKDEMIRV